MGIVERIQAILAGLFEPEVEENPVVESAYQVLTGTLGVPTDGGYCLKAARIIIEDAFGLPERALYNRLIIPTLKNAEMVPHGEPKYYWASGAETAMRLAGLTVAKPVPGDLLFSGVVSKPYGHVGILLPGELVIENTWASRGWRKTGMGRIRLTPLSEFDPVTTIVSWRRLRDALVK